MKNKFQLLILMICLVMVACSKDDEVIDLGQAPDPNELINKISTPDALVLEQENSEDIFAVFNWTPTDFGGRPVNYSIEMDKMGNNFSSPRDIITVKDFDDTLTVAEINQALILYGIEPGETVDVEIRVRSWVNFFSAPGYSNSIAYQLTPYQLFFPPVYIVGDAQGWNLDNAVELISTTPGIHTGKAKFQTNGKFRFFDLLDWESEQWGWSYFSGGNIAPELVSGEDGDSNFLFEGLTADYLITVSIPDRTISIELAGPPPPPTALFVVTAQTVNLEDAPKLASIDSAVYEEIVYLDENTKFRIFSEQNWQAAKWGSGSFENIDERLTNSGDDVSSFLFTGSSGYYIVHVSLPDNTISLEPTEAPAEILFLIGDPQQWLLDSTLAMKSLGGNVFEVIANFETDQIFRFFTELDWNADQYGWNTFIDGSIDTELAEGGDSNFKFIATSGTYKMTVSMAARIITVEPAEPPTLHLMGDDQEWTPSNALELTWLGGGKFRGTGTFTNSSIFRLFANNDPDNWDWAGEQWRYSSFVDGTIDTDDLGDGGGADSNFVFSGTTGVHTITVNLNNLSVRID